MKWKLLVGSIRSTEAGRHNIPLFIGLSTVFWIGLFRSTLWVTQQTAAIEPVGDLLVQKLLSITFLVFLGLLSFSNVVTSFSTFFLADELEFLMKQPIPKDTLYTTRFVESLLQSSWVVFIFGLPVFFAVGFGMEASWQYYVGVVAVLIPFVMIPTAVASIIALGITNILAADRTRDALLFIGVAAFAALFIVIRSVRPERLLNPDSFESIGEMMNLLATPTSVWLPSDWCMSVVVPLLWGEQPLDPVSIALLITTPLAFYFIAAWLYRPYYPRGYSKAQEGRHGQSVVTRIRDWALKTTTTFRDTLDERLNILAALGSKRSSPFKELVRKDRQVFVRDAGQWSQILIVVAILVIYLVNYKYFEIAADERLMGEAGLFYFNLAACGFVVVALGGRFLYPAVSLEGRSFWLILQAPISLKDFLWGKLLGGILPTVLVGQFLIWASNLLVVQNPTFMLIGAGTVLVFALATGAMAIGIGAMYPQFHNPNSAKIASSFGAVIYMILGMMVVLFVIVFSFRFTLLLGNGNLGDLEPWHVVNFIIAIVFPFTVGYVSLRLGARGLQRRL